MLILPCPIATDDINYYGIALSPDNSTLFVSTDSQNNEYYVRNPSTTGLISPSTIDISSTGGTSLKASGGFVN
jgi:hypothetical protein